jgi:hypothetical protein
MSEQVVISNDEGATVIIAQLTETVTISEVGAPGPQGPAGSVNNVQQIDFLSTSNIPFRMTINDDGSVQMTAL